MSAVIVDTSNGSRSSTGIPTAVFASSGDGSSSGSSSRHLISITAKLENSAEDNSGAGGRSSADAGLARQGGG